MSRMHLGPIALVAGAVILFAQPLTLHEYRLQLYVILAVCAGVIMARKRGAIANLRISLLVLTFFAWCALSLAWTAFPRNSVLELMLLFCTLFTGIVAGNICTVEQICRGVIVAGALIILFSLAVALVAPAYGLQGGTYQAGSLRGIFSHRNVFAFTLVLVLCFIPGLRTWPFWIRLTAVVALVLAILAANSSTALVATTAILFLLLIFHFFAVFPSGYRLVPLITVLPAAVILGVLLAHNWVRVLGLLGRDETLTGRSNIWASAQLVIQGQPLLGYGWGGVWSGGSVQRYISALTGFNVPHAHNGYLDLQLQVGTIGLVPLVLLLLVIFVRGTRQYLGSSRKEYVFVPIVILVFLVYNAVETRLALPLSLFVLAMLSSHLLVIGKANESRSAQNSRR